MELWFPPQNYRMFRKFLPKLTAGGSHTSQFFLDFHSLTATAGLPERSLEERRFFPNNLRRRPNCALFKLLGAVRIPLSDVDLSRITFDAAGMRTSGQEFAR